VGSQQVIGLIGGMSWTSTAEYHRLANELVGRRLGGLHSARMIVASVDFADIEACQVEGRWDEAGEILAAQARALEAAGADFVLIGANTMHKVADAVADAVTIPLLHIADAVATAVKRAGLETVGLLGTAYTMEQDFIRGPLSAAGLNVLTPQANDRVEVHRVIYSELVKGEVRDPSRQFHRGVIERLVGRGAQGIVLGCTELELLLGPDDSPVPLFPTARLHVEAAVERALGSPGG